MQSLQNGAHASKHYQGEYFGRHGAINVAKGVYVSARSGFELADISPTSEYYGPRKRYVQEKLVSLISTFCSALRPALETKRPFLAFKLLMELREKVFILRQNHGYDSLSSTELEVTLAALTKAWIFPPKWVRGDIVHVGTRIASDAKVSLATRLLAKARLSSRKEIVAHERILYLQEVTKVVTLACTTVTHQNLEWETIARLASMVNLPNFMCYAAYMDGRPDVLRKYGFSVWNAVVIKIKKP